MYTLLIVFLLLSIIFSFLCSIWEAVLLSVTPSFTQMQIQEGNELGDSLQEFKSNVDRPLAAILTLNTIAHTVGAIGVGAQATKIWGASFMSTAVVPVLMTLAILVFSEIIPKTIGANYWRELAGFTVRSLKLVMWVLAPLVFVSQIITSALKKDKEASVFSRADFGAMAELGSQQGVFDEDESNILRNLLRFNTIFAKDVMTPRTVMISADESTTISDFHDQHPHLRFSRVPVYEGSQDKITGYVLKNQVLKHLLDGKGDEPLSAIRREVLAVKESYPIPELFSHFTAKREHIAVVVDDFGGTAGIVSMEDVIETLLGLEIVDETDNSSDMQEMARKQWEERARNMGLLESGDDLKSDLDPKEPV
ncbi:hemolysin family protein [Granulosicoccus antarcticus]|uniref:Hemolysin C n=1 Tax=Granulosicoccus antarcticus IMCC3135 TaxID=1192854 RepID=A0A2Z2NU57_9GAMM|nr:hemolysin family protein [Granulosicoccus antarcticus]ASJ72290.1 Hemolysin C [Granulosicoccus antarcticus IMCC3135]